MQIEYSCCKYRCQILPTAPSTITKRDFILRSNYLCEKYSLEELVTVLMRRYSHNKSDDGGTELLPGEVNKEYTV